MPTLGSSPTDPVYQDLLGSLASEKDPRKKRNRVRLVCERDFWLFNKLILSFGQYHCGEPDNRHYGKPWVDHPWVFSRIREIQSLNEKRATDIFHNWPRYSYKTEIITKNETLWMIAKEPILTHAIITHKVAQTGSSMFLAVSAEIENNEPLRSTWGDIFGKAKITKDAVTVSRPAGPREPTVSIHGLDNQPTSFHVDRTLLDDPVVRETTRTISGMDACYESMRTVPALRKDRQWLRGIGTIWKLNDPWMRAIADGMFKRDHHSCYNAAGDPVLHSKEFLEQQLQSMGSTAFAAQMLGDPIKSTETDFKREWVQYYDQHPRDVAKGKNVYLIIDPRGGRRVKGSDFLSIWVIARGDDKRTYAVDLYRERFNLAQMGDLVAGDDGLIRKWRPRSSFIEIFLHQTHYDYLQDRQRRDNFRYDLKKLPHIKVPKQTRISFLVPEFEFGRILLPAGGFGHGSVGDGRDTMMQFLDDEYRLWSEAEDATATEHDDCLDCLAWPWQPQAKNMFPFPEKVSPAIYAERPLMPGQSGGRLFSGVSGWAW